MGAHLCSIQLLSLGPDLQLSEMPMFPIITCRNQDDDNGDGDERESHSVDVFL